MSLTKTMWDHYNVDVTDVAPCSCSSKFLFAAPVPDGKGGYKIDCSNCGRTTRGCADVPSALEEWNRIAANKQ